MQPSRIAGTIAALALAASACDDPPKKTNPFEDPNAANKPPPITESPKPQGPPEFAIYAEGPKIGWTNLLLEKDDGPQKLAEEIDANKEYVDGKSVPIQIDRKAKLTWVIQFTSALAKAGATAFDISTSSRPDYPKKVTFTPLGKVGAPPPCSVVAKVLSERRNAVWSLKGGTAVKSPKGLAGPDMAMTADNLARAAKRCEESNTVFVAADEDVEWGLLYDLAAATQTVEDAKFSTVVLLPDNPVAGRPVQL